MDASQDKYREVLVEIKHRLNAVSELINGHTKLTHYATTIESACLQTRKILELIAFSSLIANKEIYSKQHAKFATHWNAKLMLKDLERINPDFYPLPIARKPSTQPGVNAEITIITEGYLTKEKFLHVHEKCGGILHADNPYRSKTDFHQYEKDIIEWIRLIVVLLDCHLVTLVNIKDHLYVFQMGNNTPPSYNSFKRTEQPIPDKFLNAYKRKQKPNKKH